MHTSRYLAFPLCLTFSLSLAGCFGGSSSSSSSSPSTADALETPTATQLEAFSESYDGETGEAEFLNADDAVRAADLVYLGERLSTARADFTERLSGESTGNGIVGDCGDGTVDYQRSTDNDEVTWTYTFDGFCFNEPRGEAVMDEVELHGFAEMTLEESDGVLRQQWVFDELTYSFTSGEYQFTVNGEERYAGADDTGEHRAQMLDIEHGGQTYRWQSDDGSDTQSLREVRAYLPDLGHVSAHQDDDAVSTPFLAQRLFRDFDCASGVGLPLAQTGAVTLRAADGAEIRANASRVGTCGEREITGMLSGGTMLQAQDQRLGESFFSTVMRTATFDAEGGSPTPESQTVEHGELLSEPSTEPTREDFEFLGWEYARDFGFGPTLWQRWHFGFNEITSDTTLHADWWDPATDAEPVEGLSIALNGEAGSTFRVGLSQHGSTEASFHDFTATLLNDSGDVIRSGEGGDTISVTWSPSASSCGDDPCIYAEVIGIGTILNELEIEQADTSITFFVRATKDEFEVGDEFDMTLSVEGTSVSETVTIELIDWREDDEVLE